MSQVQQVKEANDIVEVIGQRLKLTRAGSYFRGLCPFHGEKTPSFFVSPSLQRYKCFGCTASGDVISFLENYEGMSFLEALEFLAKEAGIKLERYQVSDQDKLRQEIFKALDLAAAYYHYLLTKHKLGKVALSYLKDRGISKESIAVFNLGVASDNWDDLYKYLHKKKKIPVKTLLAAGLLLEKTGRIYDRFRSRIIFPLKNHLGQVVGFSGRVMDSKVKTAKYINSPETAVYEKRKLLYGLHELQQDIRKSDGVIVTEGEFDVISSAQAHVRNVVAIKGSALTEEHAKLLARFSKRVILALDTDSAGITATKRAIPIIQKEGLELRVLQVPGSKDVDDLARENPKLWRETAKKSISVYEFFLQSAIKEHDIKTPEGKRAVMDDLALIFAHIQHAVERDFYVKKLAKKLAVTVSVVERDLKKFGKEKPEDRSPAFAKTASLADRASAGKQKTEGSDKNEAYVLFLLFHSYEQKKEALLQEILETFAKLPLATPVALAIKKAIKEEKAKTPADFARILSQLAEDLSQDLFDAAYSPQFTKLLESISIEEEWKKAVDVFRKRWFKKQIASISKQLEAATLSEAEQAKLLEKIVLLRKKEKQL